MKIHFLKYVELLDLLRNKNEKYNYVEVIDLLEELRNNIYDWANVMPLCRNGFASSDTGVAYLFQAEQSALESMDAIDDVISNYDNLTKTQETLIITALEKILIASSIVVLLEFGFSSIVDSMKKHGSYNVEKIKLSSYAIEFLDEHKDSVEKVMSEIERIIQEFNPSLYEFMISDEQKIDIDDYLERSNLPENSIAFLTDDVVKNVTKGD